jgi:hypothetical protein
MKRNRRRIYKVLSENFVNDIKFSFIMPEHIVIVTKDDDVYEFENRDRKNFNGIAFIKDY